MYLDHFLKFIDARAYIEVWESEETPVFRGEAWEIFDKPYLTSDKKIKTIKTTLHSLQILLEQEV